VAELGQFGRTEDIKLLNQKEDFIMNEYIDKKVIPEHSNQVKERKVVNGNGVMFWLLSVLFWILFLWGLGERSAQAQPLCSVTQITDTTGGDNGTPSISADGTRIAFDSELDITGGNPDLNVEIFLFDTDTMLFSQVTNTTGGANGAPSISSDGTRITFESLHDFSGGNPDANFEIFLFDTDATMFAQITNTTGGGNITPSISSDGTRIAFRSLNDITGANADLNGEIFLFDTDTMDFTQITDTTGGGVFSNTLPVISSDDTRIAFRSDLDITGGNPDLNDEVFLFDANTMTFTQITETTGLNSEPSINSDGTLIAFNSTSDINGGNPDLNTEIFLFDTNTMMFTQITDTTGGFNVTPAINSDGTLIAFRSNLDITGGNPDGNFEIFLAECLEAVSGVSGGGNNCSVAASAPKAKTTLVNILILLLPAFAIGLRALRRGVRKNVK
jgi:Tol biopolymer transport system component